METIDLGAGFNLNDSKPPDVERPNNNNTNQPGPVNATTKKANANLVQKEIMKLTKPNTEQIQEHQELCLMLSRYGSSERFGDYLKSLSFQLVPAKLKKLNVEQLHEMLDRVRTSIANKTVSDIWTNSIMSGIGAIENVCSMTRLNDTIKLKGLSEVLSTDEGFLDLLEELKLNNQNLAYVSPYTRLTYILLTSIARVHGINTMMDNRQAKKNTNTSPVEQPKQEDKVTITTKQTKKPDQPREKIYDIE